jgi:hypothetical protein
MSIKDLGFIANTEAVDVCANPAAQTVLVGDLVFMKEDARGVAIAILEAIEYLDNMMIQNQIKLGLV